MTNKTQANAAHVLRIDVIPKHATTEDALRDERTLQTAAAAGVQHLTAATAGRVVWIETDAPLPEEAVRTVAGVLADPVLEEAYTQPGSAPAFAYDFVAEVAFKPGVQDNPAGAIQDALRLALPNVDARVASGRLHFLTGLPSESDAHAVTLDLLANALLHRVRTYTPHTFTHARHDQLALPHVRTHARPVATVDLRVPLAELRRESDVRVWALSEDELAAIQQHYLSAPVQTARAQAGLPEDATDVEMEILAQTWSEHCKHKIFAANIDYEEAPGHPYRKLEGRRIEGLYSRVIKATTKQVERERHLDWLVSVFSDNAGIVRWGDGIDVAVKVETHNSPSALDPYGGALTGILGVNRDILGTGMGARPVANTDVFCFASEDIEDRAPLPQGLLPPRRILEGVHQGVEDGGNKSGIPTVNGSLFFDDHYVGKPLVFVGTVGVLPREHPALGRMSDKHFEAGDRVVMVGGRVGADGIHGATFSSMELAGDAPVTAVQIGDPFTQKKVTDFLLEARDRGLYSGLTDNGAGGLSSSVGEMAERTGGAEIDLARVPLKYPGLSPFEIMISESQERMTFAVPPGKLDAFMQLARRMDVEATDLGAFTHDGFLTVRHGGDLVAKLDMEFLHDGVPTMQIHARFDPAAWPHRSWHGVTPSKAPPHDPLAWVCELLATPNVRSKEPLVRRYDHEVQAATLTKPFHGATQQAPSDAGVIDLSVQGGSGALAIAHGNQPLYSRFDPYLMAVHSVDEAVRSLVASGADPRRIALLDNFCWPDPLEGPGNDDAQHKAAGLVRATVGLQDACLAFGTPLVSGKDSMKNDARVTTQDGREVKISVPPTLVVTGIGHLPDRDLRTTGSFKAPGHDVFLLGPHLLAPGSTPAFSEYTRLYGLKAAPSPVTPEDLKRAADGYAKLHQAIQDGLVASAHDLSEGGLIVAAAEATFGHRVGVRLDLPADAAVLTGEHIGGILLSTPDPANLEAVLGRHASHVGETTDAFEVALQDGVTLPGERLLAAWKDAT